MKISIFGDCCNIEITIEAIIKTRLTSALAYNYSMHNVHTTYTTFATCDKCAKCGVHRYYWLIALFKCTHGNPLQQYIFLCCLALYGFVINCVSVETKGYTHKFPRGNRINVHCNRIVNAKLNMISHELQTMFPHKYICALVQ